MSVFFDLRSFSTGLGGRRNISRQRHLTVVTHSNVSTDLEMWTPATISLYKLPWSQSRLYEKHSPNSETTKLSIIVFQSLNTTGSNPGDRSVRWSDRWATVLCHRESRPVQTQWSVKRNSLTFVIFVIGGKSKHGNMHVHLSVSYILPRYSWTLPIL